MMVLPALHIDVDGDGKLDIVDAEGADLGFFAGNGDGTFQTEIPFPGGPTPVALAVADFNFAGKPDLAVADQGGGMTVMLNTSQPR